MMEDDYFPSHRRKDLFFEMPLQGRTAFGQTPRPGNHKDERNGRGNRAATAGSARCCEIIDGVAQGDEDQGGLKDLLQDLMFVFCGEGACSLATKASRHH